MNLYGFRRANSNSYYIPVNICIPLYSLLKPITFLMDTGSETTTISYGDALSFGVHGVTGQAIKSTGIGGVQIDNIPLYNCAVYFYYLGNSVHWELLNMILVSKPVVTNENLDAIMSVPSLLGMDFLQRYKICFERDSVILEK